MNRTLTFSAIALIACAAHTYADPGISPDGAIQPVEASLDVSSQGIALASMTTGYWTQAHDIPDFYTTVSVGIVSTKPSLAELSFERRIARLDPRRIQIDRRLLQPPFTSGSWPAEGQNVWVLPASEEKELQAVLKKQPGCNYVRKRIMPSPRAELLFKRDGLMNEASSHYEITSSTVIRSFLEAELQTLNRLLWLDHVAAGRIGLFVTIAAPGQSPPFVDAPTLHLLPQQTIFAAGDPALGEIHLSSAPNPFPFDFWSRASPEGEARTEATIVVDMTGDPNYHTEMFGKQIAKKAARFGAAAYSSIGQFLEFPGWQKFDVQWPPRYFTISNKRLDAFRDGMAPGASLLYWSKSEDSASAFAAALKKRGLLSAERARLEHFLQATPLTRTLIDAELERLRPMAEKYAAQNGTAVVRVILAVRRMN